MNERLACCTATVYELHTRLLWTGGVLRGVRAALPDIYFFRNSVASHTYVDKPSGNRRRVTSHFVLVGVIHIWWGYTREKHAGRRDQITTLRADSLVDERTEGPSFEFFSEEATRKQHIHRHRSCIYSRQNLSFTVCIQAGRTSHVWVSG